MEKKFGIEVPDAIILTTKGENQFNFHWATCAARLCSSEKEIRKKHPKLGTLDFRVRVFEDADGRLLAKIFVNAKSWESQKQKFQQSQWRAFKKVVPLYLLATFLLSSAMGLLLYLIARKELPFGWETNPTLALAIGFLAGAVLGIGWIIRRANRAKRKIL